MGDACGPLLADYEGTSPDLRGAPAFAGPGAVVVGRTVLGAGAWLGAWSVIRADGHDIRIGEDFHLGERATVHIAQDVYPTHVADRVTAGRGAVVHACTVGEGCAIERDAVILDGAKVGAGAVISAGSVVFPRARLEGGWLYSGSPAKPVARVSPQQVEGYHHKIRNERPRGLHGAGAPRPDLDCFVAPTASVRARVVAGEGVGIWYGCRLDAGTHRIVIGAGSNVQDNSRLVCEAGEIVLGPDVTVGHNVTLTDCTVAARSLIGIGSLIASGTRVDSDVLVAAGTQTEPGQRLTSGHVWAGRPARPIAPMDARKRDMLAATLANYRTYATRFRAMAHRPMLRREEE